MSFRSDASREWDGDPTIANIQTGCFQRIADATEKMAENWTKVTDERDRYKGWLEESQARYRKHVDALNKTNTGLRGQIGLLMARIRKLEAEKTGGPR